MDRPEQGTLMIDPSDYHGHDGLGAVVVDVVDGEVVAFTLGDRMGLPVSLDDLDEHPFVFSVPNRRVMFFEQSPAGHPDDVYDLRSVADPGTLVARGVPDDIADDGHLIALRRADHGGNRAPTV